MTLTRWLLLALIPAATVGPAPAGATLSVDTHPVRAIRQGISCAHLPPVSSCVGDDGAPAVPDLPGFGPAGCLRTAVSHNPDRRECWIELTVPFKGKAPAGVKVTTTVTVVAERPYPWQDWYFEAAHAGSAGATEGRLGDPHETTIFRSDPVVSKADGKGRFAGAAVLIFRTHGPAGQCENLVITTVARKGASRAKDKLPESQYCA